MTVKAQYHEFLSNNFPNLIIRSPLFYNSDIGLRFDLQEGKTGTEKYFNEVVRRATSLFGASFAPADEVFIIYRRFKRKRGKIRFNNYCFQQLQNLKNDGVDFFVEKNLYEKGILYNTALIKIEAERINYKNILIAVSNKDFPPRQPAFTNREIVFFINITRGLIFYMYDDRGLDIVAPLKDTLLPIYTKFNDWISDYDREYMDKIFKS